jgi:hypothetical protein
MSSRRTFIQSAIGAATVLGCPSRLLGVNRKRASDRPNSSAPLKVISPDLQALSFTIDNGVKVFQLTAEPVKRKIAPGRRSIAEDLTAHAPPHNPGEPGRSCPPYSGKPSAGIDRNPLARPGNPLRHVLGSPVLTIAEIPLERQATQKLPCVFGTEYNLPFDTVVSARAFEVPRGARLAVGPCSVCAQFCVSVPCRFRAVNTKLHRTSRVRCHLPRSKCMELR